MYKLFLCLRYLRRRYIALVAIVGVMLCVAMVLIVVSVMNGFLGLMENAARGMMGDVVVDASNINDPETPNGMGYYDEYIQELRKVPGVKAATPVIYAYGVLGIGVQYRQPVRMVGLRLPEAGEVTTFVKGLTPAQDPQTASFQIPSDFMQEFKEQAREYQTYSVAKEAELETLQKQLDAEQSKARPDQPTLDGLQKRVDEVRKTIAYARSIVRRPQQPGIILGIDISNINKRDKVTGEYELGLPPGRFTVSLITEAMGRGRMTEQPLNKPFTLLGYSRMGIYQVDSLHVYVDFDTLQTLMDMDARKDVETGALQPAIANQVLIKAEGNDDESHLEAIANGALAAWQRVVERHPDQKHVDIQARSWREKQADFIGPIEKQRTLVVIMFGIISLVAVVLVFAIFYMMVIQKTKDIGILKSIGGSSGGVAGIFLMYGAAIGLVGSALGVVIGCLFVHYINQIHDWIASTFNYRVFDRQVFLFDKIPNTIEPSVVLIVVIGAIVAGLIGAILPAVRAARMQPVEALRYE